MKVRSSWTEAVILGFFLLLVLLALEYATLNKPTLEVEQHGHHGVVVSDDGSLDL